MTCTEIVLASSLCPCRGEGVPHGGAPSFAEVIGGSLVAVSHGAAAAHIDSEKGPT